MLKRGKNHRLNVLIDKTLLGYSRQRYGPAAWVATIVMLMRRGFTDHEIITIMLSKWTRWAMDECEVVDVAAKSKALAVWMDKRTSRDLDALLNEAE